VAIVLCDHMKSSFNKKTVIFKNIYIFFARKNTYNQFPYE
jgi:hypothetical protein